MKNQSSQVVSIYSLLYKYSPKLLVFSVLLGAAAGSMYSLIIPFVLNGIKAQSPKELEESSNTVNVFSEMLASHGASVFFFIVFFILFTKALSVILVNNISKSAAANLKLNIAIKINKMKTDRVEDVGFAKLLNILNADVASVTRAAVAIPMVVVSTVTIIGMLGYLAVLDIYMFVVVLMALILGVVMYQTPIKMAQKFFEKSREIKDVVQEGLRGLVMGSYELKLNQEKSEKYIKAELEEPLEEAVTYEKRGDVIMHLAGISSDLLSFFIIGLIVFVLPFYMSLPTENLYGVVMALLYIAGPVTGILTLLKQLKVGKIALGRIHQLNNYEEEEYPDSEQMADFETVNKFHVESLTYRYLEAEEDDFALKPISLDFRPGQINFIVGGNGSGKSTLSKLLSLHYTPITGSILFDDINITQKNIRDARKKISVIYSNYYLFNKLYVDYTKSDEEKINHYIEALGLKGKSEFINGHFTATKLSDGQRRRLALLVALIEDKEIYIFDEWAADQDPHFKKIFYHEILPDMKRNNKIVIVITHDDRYFSCADRVIHMEDGQVLKIEDNFSVQQLNKTLVTEELSEAY